MHVDDANRYDHAAFKPWRLMALAFKCLRRLDPGYPLWREFAYEYEQDRLAIDLINGGEQLRLWVDDLSAGPAELERMALADEQAWLVERSDFLLYR